MAIQLFAIAEDFRPLAASTVDDFETAQMLADAAFANVPECAYVELTIMSDDDGFEFRIEILTRQELEEGI